MGWDRRTFESAGMYVPLRFRKIVVLSANTQRLYKEALDELNDKEFKTEADLAKIHRLETQLRRNKEFLTKER